MLFNTLQTKIRNYSYKEPLNRYRYLLLYFITQEIIKEKSDKKAKGKKKQVK